jgi:rSAM/selenodomain-associated transferase 1
MNRPRLIVFGRYPRPGKTKTRLIPALGRVGAASVQRRLTERTLAAARRCAAQTDARVAFCHDGGGDRQRMDRWLGRGDIDRWPQASGDLGRRMQMAIRAAFDQGAGRVVLVGTDIPGLASGNLNRAFASLRDHDLVLGPSTDGGYWLIGMTSPIDLFDGIRWSRPDVLEKTLALARQKGIAPCLLDPLSDLDTPADLALETGRHPSPAPFLSVIIPTLNEAGQIERTIASATSADAEILVSDGGSTDRTVAIARSLGARIVCGDRGRAGQQLSACRHPDAPQLRGSCFRRPDGPANRDGGLSF